MKNIILIGMRASGKTMLGKFLAKQLNAEFIDLDHVFETEQEMGIKNFIAQKSFSKFRDEEEKILKSKLSTLTSQLKVIATGGGVIERENNRKHLKAHSPVIFIDRNLKDILTTLTQDKSRPSLTGKSLAEESTEIYQQRLPYYQTLADYKFTYSDSVENWNLVTERFLIFMKKII